MTTQQKTWSWIAGLVVFLTALYFLRPILLPFVAAMAVAYFLDPVCDWLEERGLSRTLATSLVTAIFFVIVIVLTATVAPLIFGQISEFIAKIPSYTAALEVKIRPLLEMVAAQLDET